MGKYKWHSILVDNEELHIAQAKYLFPWLYDSHHMHSVHLIPMLKSDQQIHPVSSSNSKVDTVVLATENSNGQTTCHNFNPFSGCNLRSCNFSHCCNRRLRNGQACGKSHPGFQHNFKPPSEAPP